VAGAVVELPVRYDGADLIPLAAELGCSPEALLQRHAAGEYTVAFCGFAPGFAYLSGLDPALHVPRLASPRTAVPAGSVAIAGEYTGVYPRSSPGGWRLLGRTDAVLWDLDREPPALLTPGTRVRFVPR
jgi:KipI family sensor histidine kinase inhibitor